MTKLKMMHIGLLQAQVSGCISTHPGSDGFTHKPWPRAPRNSFLMKTHYNLKLAKLRRGISSQFTLKRA